MKKLLWLDDLRDPLDKNLDWLNYSPIRKEVEVVWLKNASEFKKWIADNELPDAICFDHDLGEDTPSGYDCAKLLVSIAWIKNTSLPSGPARRGDK